jgi:hypothetical protein
MAFSRAILYDFHPMRGHSMGVSSVVNARNGCGEKDPNFGGAWLPREPECSLETEKFQTKDARNIFST